ncbi:MAG: N-acetylmuramoyl-L-alanine amidase [Chitinophagales bacterium]|nr:N-acetylmuramoyl-L-alanine amidase [Chitinophagales bacterium]
MTIFRTTYPTWLFIIGTLLFIHGGYLSAQSTYSFELNLTGSSLRHARSTIDLSQLKVQEWLALSIIIEGTNLDASSIKGTFSTSKTYHLATAHEGASINDRYVSELYFLDKAEISVLEIDLDLGKVNERVAGLRGEVRVFIPEMDNSVVATAVLQDSCNCTMLPYVPRSVWGAKYHLDEHIYTPPATYTNVTHLIIHHSAGTNFSSDWAGVVAAYFDYHVNSNGWQDIGYNWLIDPNGVLYEGRGGGDNIQGAHMCGYNKNTMGICMLGNFEVISPSDTMMQVLTQVLGYKACKENIDPRGSGPILSYPGQMYNISGHKDGCAPNYTDCPGKFLHEKLASIRQATYDYIESSCQTTSSYDAIHLKPTLFPNPSTNYICGTERLVAILDQNGHALHSQLYVTDGHCTDISKLQSGIYFAILGDDNESVSVTFIKQ